MNGQSKVKGWVRQKGVWVVIGGVCVCVCLSEQEEGTGAPETGSGCEQPEVGAGTERGSFGIAVCALTGL